jgi:hypothetical protein
MHAPPVVQPVPPQVVPTLLHAAVQQLPVPLVPQTLLWHWSLPPHAAPAASLGWQVPAPAPSQ